MIGIWQYDDTLCIAKLWQDKSNRQQCMDQIGSFEVGMLPVWCAVRCIAPMLKCRMGFALQDGKIQGEEGGWLNAHSLFAPVCLHQFSIS